MQHTLFDKELILLDFSCKDKEEVLLTIATKMHETGKLLSCDHSKMESSSNDCSIFQTFYQSLLDRENLDCTSVGYDFAIPHGKSSSVSKPAVFFGRLKTPILWNPEEDEYIQYCFGIAVPDNANDGHLRILAELSCSILDDDFRDSLINSKSVDECYQILMKLQQNITL